MVLKFLVKVQSDNCCSKSLHEKKKQPQIKSQTITIQLQRENVPSRDTITKTSTADGKSRSNHTAPWKNLFKFDKCGCFSSTRIEQDYYSK